MNTQVTKEILFNYFSGRATVFQKQMIEDWTKDQTNREVFFSQLAAWEKENTQYEPHTVAAFDRHKKRMSAFNAATAEEVQEETAPRRRFSFLMVASIVVLLLAGAWFFRENIMFDIYKTGYGQIRSLQLQDGSKVVMNANSELKVPRFGFGSSTRKVSLTGEADFSVTHRADNQKFVVTTDRNFEVVVFGTEFVINTRKKGAKVVLNKGSVQLRYQEGNAQKNMMMKPGDLVTLDEKNQASIRQVASVQQHSAWKEHRLVFEQTTLAEVAQMFEDNYGLKVEVPDSELAGWTISGSFSADNSEELLQTLTEAAGLTYRKEGNRIIISTDH
jgi:transmembrane sensor